MSSVSAPVQIDLPRGMTIKELVEFLSKYPYQDAKVNIDHLVRFPDENRVFLS